MEANHHHSQLTQFNNVKPHLTGSFINNHQLPATILHWRVSQVCTTARVATFQSRDFPAADHVTAPHQLWISDALLHLQTLSLGEMVDRRPFHHRPLEDVDFPPKDLLVFYPGGTGSPPQPNANSEYDAQLYVKHMRITNTYMKVRMVRPMSKV